MAQPESPGSGRLHDQIASSPGGTEQPDVVQDSNMCRDTDSSAELKAQGVHWTQAVLSFHML